ncbi:MAG TPA: polyprenyl synthetase family protein, partial [Candidatus Hodarchaeales archaeon]|nr:polyprenyl synthetase family protein [Candidatus Hodarchaeales archaeon]
MVNILQRISELGSRVEGFMLAALEQNVEPDFVPLVIYQAITGGKRIRPAITILFAEAVNESSSRISEDVARAAAGIELIHSYSLIVDDIIDSGDMRRNQLTTRAKFSNEMALLVGMSYRESINDCAVSIAKSEQVLKIYSDTIRNLIEGERLDILMEQRQSHDYFLTT